MIAKNRLGSGNSVVYVSSVTRPDDGRSGQPWFRAGPAVSVSVCIEIGTGQTEPRSMNIANEVVRMRRWIDGVPGRKEWFVENVQEFCLNAARRNRRNLLARDDPRLDSDEPPLTDEKPRLRVYPEFRPGMLTVEQPLTTACAIAAIAFKVCSDDLVDCGLAEIQVYRRRLDSSKSSKTDSSKSGKRKRTKPDPKMIWACWLIFKDALQIRNMLQQALEVGELDGMFANIRNGYESLKGDGSGESEECSTGVESESADGEKVSDTEIAGTSATPERRDKIGDNQDDSEADTRSETLAAEQAKQTVVIHSMTDEPPAEYREGRHERGIPLGPLTGTKTAIGFAAHSNDGISVRNYRKHFDGRVLSGKLWVRESSSSPGEFEAFVRSTGLANPDSDNLQRFRKRLSEFQMRNSEDVNGSEGTPEDANGSD